ncbi:hypothetical protein GCM10007216_07060 [Thalassobacillus devorans]|uniref:Uncharacterized protein n=1 Tax=Thalassobacillus devorans TaxID=279813 RepID=A0ABQ1NK39_9BACI|nr:hypothetical protein [Thalassobacillus devorans]GGC79187.1 hypothetical protein GCM10007216_07060 [Thalassobacillus devorans]
MPLSNTYMNNIFSEKMKRMTRFVRITESARYIHTITYKAIKGE